MANETPRFTSRLPYVIACLFGLTLFFLDITYQAFDPLDQIKINSKNFGQSSVNNLKNSFVSLQINFSEKKLLIDQNKSLKEELSILSVIAQQDIFNSKLVWKLIYEKPLQISNFELIFMLYYVSCFLNFQIIFYDLR